jgi:NTE family protein
LALSGGGSRAIAFHLGCLRALNDLGLLDRIKVLSTISGGSVIGAYFAYSPQKTFSQFYSEVCLLLKKGFHSSIAIELVKPANLIYYLSNLLAFKIDSLTSFYEPSIRRYPSLTDMFHRVLQRHIFPGLKMSSPRRGGIDVVIGACELRTGSAFRFGNNKSGDWKHGELVAWDVDLGFAVAASAAYPIYLSAFDREWQFRKNGVEEYQRVLITDGGVYDNLGLQVLEPGRDPKYSLHNFPCEYLIVCNAGQGQDRAHAIPTPSVKRIARSFEIIHRRVQESSMNRLHQMRSTGHIKGFVMPYLGQQDSNLPSRPSDLIPRSAVIDYPTNFAAMSDDWIEKLAGRGEQLTRLLVDYYLADIL